MRLTAGIWVSAYLARLRLADIPAFVVRRGDDTAGAVLVKLNTLDGRATCFQRSIAREVLFVIIPHVRTRHILVLHTGNSLTKFFALNTRDVT